MRRACLAAGARGAGGQRRVERNGAADFFFRRQHGAGGGGQHAGGGGGGARAAWPAPKNTGAVSGACSFWLTRKEDDGGAPVERGEAMVADADLLLNAKLGDGGDLGGARVAEDLAAVPAVVLAVLQQRKGAAARVARRALGPVRRRLCEKDGARRRVDGGKVVAFHAQHVVRVGHGLRGRCVRGGQARACVGVGVAASTSATRVYVCVWWGCA
jgi:hypothetical protein